MIPLMLSSELRPAATNTGTNSSASTGTASSGQAANAANTPETTSDSETGSGFSELLGQMQPGNGGKLLPLSGGNRLPLGQTSAANGLLSDGQTGNTLKNGVALGGLAAANIATSTTATAAIINASADADASTESFPMASDLLQQIRQAFQPGKLQANATASTADSDDDTLQDDASQSDETSALAAITAVLPMTPPPAAPTSADSALPAMHDLRRFGDSPLNGVGSAADGTASTTDNNAFDSNSLDNNGLDNNGLDNTGLDNTLSRNLANNAGNDPGQSGDGQSSLDALDLSAGNRTSTGTAFSTQLAQHSRIDTSATSTTTASSAQDPLLNNRNDARLALDQDPDAWGQQLGSRIMTLIGKDIQEARIHLDPPELGALEIRMTVDSQDQTRIQIHAQHPQVRDVLEAQSNRLRDALAQQGLSLNEFNVSDQSQQQAGARSGNQGDNSGAGNTGSGADAMEDGLELDADNPAVRVTQHQGLVSTYA